MKKVKQRKEETCVDEQHATDKNIKRKHTKDGIMVR